MATEKKFDQRKLSLLNDPIRKKSLNPDFIWNTIGIKDPKTVVDIGAGTGFFAKEFMQKMQHGKIYALDISDIMIDYMREHLSVYKDKIVVQKMEESQTSLPEESADLIYMINLYHELNNRLQTLKETFRILKKRGRIAIIDWKKKQLEFGPPVSIKVALTEIENDLKVAGFSEIRSYSLKFHNFLVACRN